MWWHANHILMCHRKAEGQGRSSNKTPIYSPDANQESQDRLHQDFRQMYSVVITPSFLQMCLV